MNDTTKTQASELKRLAKDIKFEQPGELSDAENLLLEKAPIGDVAVCRFGKRRIRAQLVAWLCTDEQARKHVHARGIRVYGADITGPLDLSFVKIPFPLGFQNCRLKGNIINLSRAEVSELDLQGSAVHGITADGLVVKNHAFFRNGFTANGEVTLIAAQIGGDLDCSAGSFINEGGSALSAPGVNVKGSVVLTKGSDAQGKEIPFTANGEVNLDLAQIGGQLSCVGGNFSNPSGHPLSANRAIVKSSVFLSEGFKADGRVYLLGTQIGGDLTCDGGDFRKATLDLTDASAATLRDTGLNDPAGPESSWTIWPPGDKDHYLLLDGFTYGRIASGGRINVKKRLDWLARQRQRTFHPQPYLQLAKVLEDSGDSDGRLRVLVEMERLRRKVEDHDWIDRVESFLYEWSVGYGYRPLWAVGEAVALTALGWVIYRRSYLAGGMVPTDKDACAKFRESGAPIPGHYPSFSPLVYSVENSLPLVKLGQGDKWQPDPEPADPRENQLAPKLGYRGVWQWRAPQPPVVGNAPGGHDASATSPQTGAVAGQGATAISADDGTAAAPASTSDTSTISRRHFFAPLERLLVAVGLRSSTDVNHTPSSLSRFGTSPRFVTWFLWFQILLGWLLATLFVAGVSGIVHK